jgi:hypothetical protein
LTVVGSRGDKLVDEITVGTMDFHPVKAGALRPQGSLDK